MAFARSAISAVSESNRKAMSSDTTVTRSCGSPPRRNSSGRSIHTIERPGRWADSASAPAFAAAASAAVSKAWRSSTGGRANSSGASFAPAPSGPMRSATAPTTASFCGFSFSITSDPPRAPRIVASIIGQEAATASNFCVVPPRTSAERRGRKSQNKRRPLRMDADTGAAGRRRAPGPAGHGQHRHSRTGQHRHSRTGENRT